MTPISVDKSSDTPIYEQIAEQIRVAVARGDLGTQERIPATRDLARTLGVNRLTVSRAYATLVKEGVISSHVGRGSFVTAAPGAGPASVRTGAGSPPPEIGTGISWGSLMSRTSQRVTQEGVSPAGYAPPPPGAISFASLFPDPELFPVESFRRALDGVMRRMGGSILGYGPPAGHPPLRRMIAEELEERGMNVTEREVLITSGSQQGIDLVARALLEPGDAVLVENPTYTGAVQVFQSYGAELVGVPLDDEGAVVSLFEQAVARRRPKLIYLMPNFQNPTSETMSLRRRRALIDLASARRLPILEDDFGGALRFEGPELPALKALDRGGNVIYLSTFAKKLLPGLRIGWIAAPADLAERLGRLKQITDYSTSLLLQVALLEFCQQGDLDRHLAHVVNRYRERRDAMLSAMKRCFPPEATWSRPKGGLVVWVTLPGGVDAEEVAADAQTRGVMVGRGDLFHLDGGSRRQNLRLTFAQAGPREIHRGIRLLGEIIKGRIKSRREERRTASAAEMLPLI